MAIGYNVNQINSLMEEIANSYNKVGSVISDGWPSVSSTMQQYWKGEDEQSYENAFCERMCFLYTTAYTVVNNLIGTLNNIGEGWHTFQQENLLNDATVPQTFATNFEKPTITQNDKIISYNPAQIDDSTIRGIEDGAQTSIQNSMSEYLNSIKSELNNLYANMDASNAFLGATQVNAIKNYIEKMGASLADVITAARDIYEAVEKLANARYTKSEESVEEITKEENTTNVLETMKWQG